MNATHNRGLRAWRRVMLIGLGTLHCFQLSSIARSADDAAVLPASVAVKILPTPARSADTMTAMQTSSAAAVTQPTLPDARLPQYPLDSPLLSVADDPSRQSPLRFQLSLPERSLIVEATIRIDGEAFQAARRRRIDRLVEAVRSASSTLAAPTEAIAAPVNADAQSAANAESAEQEQSTPVAPPSNDPEAGEEPLEVDRAAAAVTPAPEYRSATTDDAITASFFRATGMQVSHDAVAWLLLTRIDGPTLLMLNPRFQRFRSDQRPAFDVLDTDEDGVLSPAEIERARESMIKCDLNRNDVVDYLEIQQVAVNRRRLRPPQIDNSTLLRLLPSEPTEQVDVKITVDFHTTDPQRSRLSIDSADEGSGGLSLQSRVDAGGDPAVIALSIDGTPIWFSAVQPAEATNIDQISLGAVDDGYPLLPLLDPNDDGRLTIRELRGLVDRLRQLDRNGDGQLDEQELRAPIRVCIGLGGTVHRELADIRSIGTRPSEPAPGPQWFSRMDRNEDGDLSRSEFPGTDEQFAELDLDGDGLISAEEALAAEAL